MAKLIACPQCGHQISPEARDCPACGHPLAALAASRASRRAGAGCAIVILIVVIGLIALIQEGSRLQEEEAKNPTCISDFTLCKDNEELVSHHQSKAHDFIGVECASVAESQATYGSPELSWPRFPWYVRGDSFVHSGVARLIDREARFKNAFVASVAVIATCDYDLRTDIASVTVTPR